MLLSFWLAGEASWFARPGGADNVSFVGNATLRELLDELIVGSRVTLCMHCCRPDEGSCTEATFFLESEWPAMRCLWKGV